MDDRHRPGLGRGADRVVFLRPIDKRRQQRRGVVDAGLMRLIRAHPTVKRCPACRRGRRM
jgi:hypothetical protein